jgi:hypothetical protein
MLDVSDKDNYKWVDDFIPAETTTSNSTQSPNPPINLGAIIGGTVGGVAVLVICASIIFLLYRRKKSKKDIPIPVIG